MEILRGFLLGGGRRKRVTGAIELSEEGGHDQKFEFWGRKSENSER
jgi:hypothetical protein